MSRTKRIRPARPVCKCGCGRLVSWRGWTRGGWCLHAPGCYIAPRQKPRHAAWVDDGSGFWDWFAGFLDGEGFFGFIPRTFNRTYHTPVVRISVRLDDRAILDEIASFIGGTVRVQAAYGTSNPQARWGITSMSDCLRLIEILDAHPLRAKKALDYATWREAVLEKDRVGNTGRVEQLAAKLIEDRRWNPEIMKGGDAE